MAMTTIAVDAAGVDALRDAVIDAKTAAHGDSNDAEISLLQTALSIALELLGVDETALDATVDDPDI